MTAVAREVNAELAAAIGAVLRRVGRAYPLDLEVATVVVMAVLDRMPEYARFAGSGDVDVDGWIVELTATVLERGPFNGAASSTSAVAAGGR